MTYKLQRQKLAGFTLVELSIVLVIIGLIVGSVLAGQSLIRSAQLRSQITQLNQFSAAVNTFYTKFEALAGDWTNNPAVAGYITRTPATTGRGNGNGVLESDCSAGLSHVAHGEGEMFWSDLSAAGLVNFTSTYADAGCAVQASLTTLLPGAAYKHGNKIAAFGRSDTGLNYYFIAALVSSAVTTGIFTGGTTSTGTTGIAPLDAYTIDLKMDDGSPVSGTVLAAGVTPTVAATADVYNTANTCVNTDPAPDEYQTSITTYDCALQIQMQ